MSKKITTEEFIKKAKNIHGDKYIYNLVNYKKHNLKIKIICKKHGIFEQTPNNHTSKKGCPICAKEKNHLNLRDSLKTFIRKAMRVHNNKYDYSLVNYKNNKTKVKIICPSHGAFNQTPNSHLSGAGCMGCFGSKKLTTKEFIKKARKTHGDKYDYSLVKYEKNSTKIKIICPTHGVFIQTPNSHLMGAGCIKCYGNKKLTTKQFIEKAINIHKDKYDYSLIDYKNNLSKVKIICKKHGVLSKLQVLTLVRKVVVKNVK